MSTTSPDPQVPQVVIYLVNDHVAGFSTGEPSAFTPATPLTSAIILTLFQVLDIDTAQIQPVELTIQPTPTHLIQ